MTTIWQYRDNYRIIEELETANISGDEKDYLDNISSLGEYSYQLQQYDLLVDDWYPVGDPIRHELRRNYETISTLIPRHEIENDADYRVYLKRELRMKGTTLDADSTTEALERMTIALAPRFSPDPDKALDIVLTARDVYRDVDDVWVEAKGKIIPTPNGAWVSAYVFVSQGAINDRR